MSGDRKLDGRRAKALEAELIRRAEAVLSGDGSRRPIGPVAHALFGVAARIGEEVIRRLDQAPLKQADNFYTAAGIGRDPARSATLPVAVKLVDSENKAASAPPQLQLMAATDKGPVFFETVTGFDLAPGRIAALRGIDVAADAITIPSSSVMAAALPAAAPLKRRLRSGAAAGATKLQVDPAAGLAPGMLLRIGDGDAAHHYEATAVEGDLVTIEPALEAGLPPDAPVLEVGDFAPFETVTRNHQSHALYLGHASLLDVPSAVTITISGANLPEGAVWSWWGTVGEGDPPAWHALEAVSGSGGLRFSKEAGKPAKTKVKDRESLWLRAEWEGKSPSSATARDLRLAIGGGAMCGAQLSEICGKHLGELTVTFEAVGNGTPLVTNVPFHPFGLEPRLFDSFHIGSNEALSKVGAQVAICFRFAGATLGPLAIFKEVDATRAYGVGADGLLYRIQLTPAPAGTAGHTSADLRAMPSPSRAGAAALLQPQSPLAAWQAGGSTMIAVAGDEVIQVAELPAGSDLSKVTWLQLPLQEKGRIVTLECHSGSNGIVLYALQEIPGEPPALPTRRLLVWDGLAPGAPPTSIDPTVTDLIEVHDDNAVMTVEFTGTQALLRLRKAAANTILATGPRTDLPQMGLRAAADLATAGIYYLLGYDEEAGQYDLTLVKIDTAGAHTKEKILTQDEPLPVSFSRGPTILSPNEVRPIISIATQNPTHVTWYRDGSTNPATIRPAVSSEPLSLGTSANLERAFVFSDDYVVVQRPDRGAFFRPRPAGEAPVPTLRVSATQGLLVDAAKILPPAGSDLVVHFVGTGGGLANEGIFLSNAGAVTGGARTVLQPAPPLTTFTPPPAFGDEIVAYRFDSAATAVASGSSGKIRLAGTTNLLDLTMQLDVGGTRSVWTFTRTTSGNDDWSVPIGFPPPPFLAAWTWRKLKEIDRVASWDEAALLPNATAFDALAAELQIWAAEDMGGRALALNKFGSGAAGAVVYSHAKIRGGEALFLATPRRWDAVGPDEAGNPSLSWEYWNGQCWWALPTEGAGALADSTESFTQDGGVFFNVPADIQSSEVNGRKQFWIRARLVRGDYGEARVTVVNRPGAEAGTSEQTVTRDVSAVRAPQITQLKLGYCALELVRPEIVLTADSLGYVDQTSANEAGLEIPVFTPVGELMNPVAAAEIASAAATEAARCDLPCPPPSPAPGSDCEAPGAYDSCDSPCIPPPGHQRTATGEASGFVRGLMLGFEKGFKGNTIALYVDADPTGPSNELVAEMLRDGRFVPIRVAGDTSYGLTEPGIVTLAIPAEPDRSELFGATAHWLRLRPKREAAKWSPRVRAIHLNAVLARSVETRVMERLGTSTGLEAQTFRLSEAPVDPGSLVLRVRETLAEEDDPNGELDVATYPSGLSGKWVRWEVSEDLIEGDEPERAFILDAEQGIIRFGDGTAGRIPPLGGDILAETYAKVIGNRANGVAPGSKLQLLTSLAGVERITAVDYAAGGSDAESPESARRRAPAKVRHGRRILTRADLEDHALTLSPEIAQVSAENRGGGMRLVVVLGGAEPKPSPAVLRGFADAIREVSGYGLARPGGLDVVGPRLLPIAIELVLQPRAPDLFAEAAEQAKARLVALFDPAIGNHDGSGWPLGRLPAVQDIAAALTPLEALALPVEATLRRADKEAAVERGLPETIPSDVLVRLDPDAIVFERSQEAAA